MRGCWFLVVGLCGLLCPPPGLADAANFLALAPGQNATDSASLAATGEGNVVFASQQEATGNDSLVLTIAGNRNGGAAGLAFSGPLMPSGLVPGAIDQKGSDNAMRIDVRGDDNIFTFRQTGTANRLTVSIAGNNSKLTVVQSGAGNSIALAQRGTGNVANIEQR